MIVTQPERLPITEDWLKAIGFRWHQFDRQPDKQWCLWIGDALVEEAEKGRRMFSDCEDLGIEVTANWHYENRERHHIEDWFCWLRSDTAGRYHRFIHLRHIVYQDELISIIQGITGAMFDPANNIYGSMHHPEHAARIRQEQERLDLRRRHDAHESSKWYAAEKDDTRGRALPEHMDAAIKNGGAK